MNRDQKTSLHVTEKKDIIRFLRQEDNEISRNVYLKWTLRLPLRKINAAFLADGRRRPWFWSSLMCSARASLCCCAE